MTRREPDWADEAARVVVTACEFSQRVKPLTWVDDLHENVAAALRAERERCAGIAGKYRHDIEKAIRAGDQP